MFYSQFILAKKGPLGTIWIAAHLERKLRKNQVADTDIGFSVDSILFPEMPIALRLSSHLLLGVVRIYSRKVNYLFDDCSEALLKVKQAFRSTAVDLPPEESTAPYHSITLPETFDLDDFELPDSEIFQGNYVDHHISSKEQITLQDTMEGVVYSTSNFGLDERFGDGDACGLDLDEELLVEKAATVEHATGTSNSDVDPQASDQVNALFKYDHNQDTPTIPEALPAGGIMNQQIDEYDGDNEPVEYAQAPCTPGLWEEPNLSNIQETSAYDDHPEPENHTITEFTVKESFENASSEQHYNQSEPLEKSPPHIATTEQMSFDKSPPHIETTEQMSMNDLVLTPFIEPVSVDQIRSMSPIPEVPETVVSVVDDPVKAVELFNNKFRDQEPEAQTVDDSSENYVQHEGMSNNIAHVVNQDNAFHPISQLELNTEPSSEHNFVSPSPQDQAFSQPKDSTIPVQSTHDIMPSFDFMGLRPCVTLSNHDAMKQSDSVPPSGFTSLQEHPSAYGVPNSMQGEVVVQHATETLERNIPETYLPEVGPSNAVQVASSIPNRQVDNVIEREAQVHDTNSYTSNFPAHEKVLSFSQGHSDVPTELVPESTPAEIVHPRVFSSTISNSQVENVIEREAQVHNTNSYTSSFPAPEKVLSFSQGHSDVPKELVPESTPAEIVHPRVFPSTISREAQVHSTNSYTSSFPAPEKVLSFSQGHSDVPKESVPESTPVEIVHPRAFPSTISNRQVENVIEREAHVHNTNSYTSNFPAPENVLSFSQGHSDVVESTPAETVMGRAFVSTISDRQVEHVTERAFQVNNSNSYTSNFPAPEKLLSFSQQVPKNVVLPESTPIIAPVYEGDAGSNMYSGRKRSFTESSQSQTAQSLNFNLNESSTFYTTNTTRDSFQDDDLLSSILVGSSSTMLKMKPTPTPTPPTEVAPSTKRRRQSAPKTAPKTTLRTGISKRKVLMDDSMVLHGDTIRDQLTNTEDIRRLRKKAPCTHSEISMIEKQFWADNLFGETIFTGMSNKLTSLQRQLYDISKIVVSQNGASLEVETDQKSTSQNDEKDIQQQQQQQQEMVTENTGVFVSVEPDVPRENEEDHVAMKDVPEAPSKEAPLETDNNTTDLDYYDNQPQMHTTGDFTELFGPEHDVLDHGTAMEIDDKSFPDSDTGVSVIPSEVESLTLANVVPSDMNDMSAEPGEVEKASQLLMGPPPGFDSDKKVDLQSADMDASLQTGSPPDFDSNGKIDLHSTDMDPGPPPGFHSNEEMDLPSVADMDPGPPPGFHSNEEMDLQSVADMDPGPPPGFHSNEEIDLQSADMDPGPPPGFHEKLDLKSVDMDPGVDINANKSIESEVASEIKPYDASVRETSEEKQEPVADTSTTFSPETNGLRSDIATLNQDIEIRKNEDAAYPSTVGCNAQNQVSNGIFGEEESVPVAAYDSELNQALEDALLDEREKPGHPVTIPATTLNLEDIPAHNRVDINDDDDDGVNDTDFLNFDDVDDEEADDDYIAEGDGEATKILDNSGWSSRTRAVAKYLQIMFDKEGERGRNTVAVNNLLAGKTRKEASRMFFETLVLKTKDYIHVEQTDPFENINLFPRAKLLKSEF